MSIPETLKTVVELARAIDNTELHRELLSLQAETLELYERSAALEKENERLRRTLDLRELMQFDKNVYWLEEEGELEGPFCPRCCDGEYALRRMVHFEQQQAWACPTCQMMVSSRDGGALDVYQAQYIISSLPASRSI